MEAVKRLDLCLLVDRSHKLGEVRYNPNALQRPMPTLKKQSLYTDNLQWLEWEHRASRIKTLKAALLAYGKGKDIGGNRGGRYLSEEEE